MALPDVSSQDWNRDQADLFRQLTNAKIGAVQFVQSTGQQIADATQRIAALATPPATPSSLEGPSTRTSQASQPLDTPPGSAPSAPTMPVQPFSGGGPTADSAPASGSRGGSFGDFASGLIDQARQRVAALGSATPGGPADVSAENAPPSWLPGRQAAGVTESPEDTMRSVRGTVANVPEAAGQVGQALVGRMHQVAQEQETAFEPSSVTQEQPYSDVRQTKGYYTPEQMQQQFDLTANAVMGVSGGDLPIAGEIGAQAGKVAGEAAGPVAAKIGGMIDETANDLGRSTWRLTPDAWQAKVAVAERFQQLPESDPERARLFQEWYRLKGNPPVQAVEGAVGKLANQIPEVAHTIASLPAGDLRFVSQIAPRDIRADLDYLRQAGFNQGLSLGTRAVHSGGQIGVTPDVLVQARADPARMAWLQGTIVHEIGHSIYDNLPEAIQSAWETHVHPGGRDAITYSRHAATTGEWNVSSGASDNPQEDFAESYRVYRGYGRPDDMHPLSATRRQILDAVDEWLNGPRGGPPATPPGGGSGGGGLASTLRGVAGDVGGAVQRFFHGTGSAFDRPDAMKFDPNGLFGPGYYLTSDARVASDYSFSRAGGGSTMGPFSATEGFARNDATLQRYLQAKDAAQSRVAEIDTQLTQGDPWDRAKFPLVDEKRGLVRQLDQIDANISAYGGGREAGPNVRAVNVPSGLRLLDADAVATPADVNAVRQVVAQTGFHNATTFEDALPTGRVTGEDVYKALNRAGEGDKEWVNAQIQRAGYDGITYAGGRRVPLMDATGQPIEHTAVVIFPESLPKIRNAISGTTMGSPPAIGGAVVGGAIGASQGDTPEERARNAALGMASGAVGGHLLASGSRAAGLSITPVEGEAATVAQDATRAGNILLSKLPEGVRDVVQETQAAAPQAMEDARRGVLSDQAVSDLASQVGAKVDDVVKRWKPGQAQNAETLLALRDALVAKSQDVLSAQQAIQQGGNSGANLLKLQLALKEHQAIQEAVSGTTAEAGRVLRQFRQTVTGAIQAGQPSQIEALLKKLGGREWTEQMAARLGQIDTTDPTQVATFIRSAAQPKLRDYVTELFYNSILSGPQTHIANSVSNAVSALAGPVERGVSAAFELPIAAMQGRPRERFFGEARAGAFGLLQGLQDGVRGASYVLKNGFSLDDALKGEMHGAQAFRGTLGAVINAPSRALNAEDAFFRGVLYRSNLNAQAYRMAAREGLSGGALANRIAELLTTPPADLMERAGKMSEYQLFRQAPGKVIQALTGLRNSLEVGIGDKTVQPLRFVIPFLQTPVNVTKYGLERSPLGWLNVVGKQGANVSDSAARAMMGSVVAAAIGAAVETGKVDITGAVPTSPTERDAFYRQGKLPFALRIGDTWYQYQRWEPFNQPLSMVAATVDAVRNAKAGVSPTQIGGQAALSIAQNLVSQNWFSGLNNLMNAIQDPARYGSQLAEQLAGSAVPFSGLSRSVANAVDPRQRNPRGVVQAMESTIPGVSQSVPARLNAFGQPETQAGSPFIPYKSQTASTSPLEAELARLRVEPGLPGKSVRGITLTPEEQQSHHVVAGHFIQQQLTQTMNNPGYAALDDTAKAHALETAITEGRNIGAERFIAALIRRDGAAAVRQRIAQKRGAPVPSGTTR